MAPVCGVMKIRIQDLEVRKLEFTALRIGHDWVLFHYAYFRPNLFWNLERTDRTLEWKDDGASRLCHHRAEWIGNV